jgi:hypothetical protein
MQHKFLKYFSFVSWILDLTFKVTSESGETGWRTMSVLVVAEVLIFMGLVGSVSLFVGHRNITPHTFVTNFVVIVMVTASIAINHRMLRSRVQYDA